MNGVIVIVMKKNTFRLLILRIFVVLHLSMLGVVWAALGPEWFGTWKSQDGTTKMKITATRIHQTRVIRDESGKRHSDQYTYEWSAKTEDSPDDGTFGYVKRARSSAVVANRYEACVRMYRKDPTDFGISSPNESRRALLAIRPASYRAMYIYPGGDSYAEYITDGDVMLEIVDNKFSCSVTRFYRVP
jgi:hypothetical protein